MIDYMVFIRDDKIILRRHRGQFTYGSFARRFGNIYAHITVDEPFGTTKDRFINMRRLQKMGVLTKISLFAIHPEKSMFGRPRWMGDRS